MKNQLKNTQNGSHKRYVNVILPLKYSGKATYFVSACALERDKFIGKWVLVNFAGKEYRAVVHSFVELSSKDNDIVFKEIIDFLDIPSVSAEEIEFWEQIANYYMCTVGEVFKAACTALSFKKDTIIGNKKLEYFLKKYSSITNSTLNITQQYQQIQQTQQTPNQQDQHTTSSTPQHNQQTQHNQQSKNHLLSHTQPQQVEAINSPSQIPSPQLSEQQTIAYNKIKAIFATTPSKAALLKGVTGSGKTELYINLAIEQIQKGNNVLLMVPEIALSKQLEERLRKIFAEKLLVYHSQESVGNKILIHKILRMSQTPIIVLGTRSALFLPYHNLGLIIIDEEHDFSYKQTEPAPRYHARDAALMLARIHKSKVLMGSATPSLEALYNTSIKKFSLIELNAKFYGAPQPNIEIIDSIYARKTRQMKGSFSQQLINKINKEITTGGQVLIFRNRRSYSPILECTECGYTPHCPHCNVALSYHKYNNTLSCHHCEYNVTFSQTCPQCNNKTFTFKGAGTERIEEELKTLFPNINIARYDADIAKSKRAQEKVLKEFARGETKILVGTQMISKGFDFKFLSLVVVLQAETIVGIQDFRADEKAIQLIYQLMGRTGRRENKGTLLIQTSNKEHPVFANLLKYKANSNLIEHLMQERKDFNFAPYLRMVKIIIKNNNPDKLELLCQNVKQVLNSITCKEITGPFLPPIDKIRGEYIKCFYVKFTRDTHLQENKEMLKESLHKLKGSSNIIFDVDPI